MERTGGIEANAAHSKKARRAEKRKKAPTKIVGVKPKTANFTIDTFDMSKPIDILTDVCAMCKHGHDFGVLLTQAMLQVPRLGNATMEEDGDEEAWVQNDIVDHEGVWVSRYSLTVAGKSRRFVHYYCAAASPEAWLDVENMRWKNVNREVTRSNAMTCSECKVKGATIGCLEDKCSVVLHLHCALLHGFTNPQYNSSFLCKKHRIDGKKTDELLEMKFQTEVSRGVENVAVTFTNNLDRANPQSEVQYVATNIDSDDFIRNARNVDELENCECIDLCDDVEKCPCIKQGRNYTYQGLFIPGSTHQVKECNFRCHCSYRRCTNRVVEKGLNFRLQVTRVKDGNNGHAAWDRNVMAGQSSRYAWGVKTLDYIPRYSFVCEVMGQVKLVPALSTTSSLSFSSANAEERPSSSSSNGEMNVDWAMGSRHIRMRDWQSKFVVPKEEPVVIPVSIKDLLLSVSPKKEEYFIDLSADDDDEDEAEQQQQQPGGAIKQENLKRKRDEEDQHSESVDAEAMVAAGVAETLKVEKNVREQLLFDNLCLECSEYGNVGSFLRRRMPGMKPMFIKQLVFNSNRTDAAPKLALFAVRNIEAGSELLL